MPFTPTLPSNGVAGWNFLGRTLERQTELFNKSPDIARDIEYFKENIRSVETLDDFMADRRILKVALGAFGLPEEINKGALVRKILAEGTEDRSAFAVRLNNSDYLKFAETFKFDADENFNFFTSKIDGIVANYERESFEVEVGNVDPDMRLALNFERTISGLASAGYSEDTGWFKIMGDLPMRKVIEGAFQLPSQFSTLDIDRQKDILADKANALFGGKSIEVFNDPANVETMIRRYLITQQVNQGPTSSTPGFAALSILGAGLGSQGIENLLLSTF